MAKVYDIKIVEKDTDTGEETALDGPSLHDCTGLAIYTMQGEDTVGGFVHNVSLKDLAEMLACDESLRPAVSMAAEYVRQEQFSAFEDKLLEILGGIDNGE